MHQTTLAFDGMCKHYLPTAPKGCGIRAIRVSQDPLEAYFVRCCLTPGFQTLSLRNRIA
jgi:hypothetical protein